jgi:hypothetical protein
MHHFEEFKELSLFQQHKKGFIILAGIVLVLIMMIVHYKKSPNQEIRQMEFIKEVTILPPPLSPKLEEVKIEESREEEMIVQEKIEEIVPPTDPDQDSTNFSTSIIGEGQQDGFGLTSGREGFGTRTSPKKHGKWDSYVYNLQESIKDLMDKSAVGKAEIKIWIDERGKITKINVNKTTDSDLAFKIKKSLYNSIIFSSPPIDMPMPITLKIESKKF